ncbi:unnamed protein product [Paramecium octaurelia]|uniref:Isoleucine--tRNA ligase n=1 Tax=Paramecium octaurelia TaxID=43137 RepID=A0A8S1YAH6_PAROT|nr:unnamed protein product [Paramecium octaurelia]
MTSKLLMIPKTKFNPRFHPTSREIELLSQVIKFEQNVDSKAFTLHESPLSVHGKLHFGHFYNKVHKDILKRYKLLRGYKITPSMSFELFGPQIEHAAFQQLIQKGTTQMEYNEIAIRQICSKYAEEQLKSYLEQIQRWGILDQEISLTIDPRYQKQVLYQLAHFLDQNQIFREQKIVIWSKSRFSEVPLDSVIITQRDVPAHAVKFKFTRLSPSFKKLKCSFYLVLELPSPWKIPSAKAIKLVEQEWLVMKDKEALIMSKQFFNTHKEEFSMYQFVGTIVTSDFLNLTVDNGLNEFIDLRMIEGEENNIICPAHQMDDIPIAKRYKLDRTGMVNENGQLVYEDEEFDILNNEASQQILKELRERNRILDVVSSAQEVFYHHKVTGEQLLLRSVPAWFLNFDEQLISDYKEKYNLNEEETKQNNKDEIYTPYTELMEALCGQWCITEHNVWGIPIPLFRATVPKKFEKLKNGFLLNAEVVKHFADLVEKNGSDIYWNWNIVDLLPDTYKPYAQHLEKHTCVLNRNFSIPQQCDLIYEGIDQNEGFLFSSQMMMILLQKKFNRKIQTHTVLQYNKDKISKTNCFTLENIIDGQIKANEQKQYGSGADVLRALVTSINEHDEFSQFMLDKKKEQINYIRKIYWQIIGCLENASVTPVDFKDLEFCDSYIYQQLILFVANITKAYEDFNFGLAYQLYIDFMQNYVSLYVASTRNKIIAFHSEYQNSLYIYYKIYDITLNVIQPILCFNARDIHTKLPTSWPKIPVSHFQEAQQNIVTLSLLHKLQKEINTQIDEVQERIKQKSISKKLEIVFIIEPNTYEQKLIDIDPEQLALFFSCGKTTIETDFLNKKRPNHVCMSSFFVKEQFYHQKINFHVKFYEVTDSQCPRCLEHKPIVSQICQDCTDYIQIEEEKLKQIN